MKVSRSPQRAASTSSVCPSTFTRGNTLRIRPFSSITNVVRSIPMNVLPYRLFSFETPYAPRTFPSGSERSGNEREYFSRTSRGSRGRPCSPRARRRPSTGLWRGCPGRSRPPSCSPECRPWGRSTGRPSVREGPSGRTSSRRPPATGSPERDRLPSAFRPRRSYASIVFMRFDSKTGPFPREVPPKAFQRSPYYQWRLRRINA